MLSPFNGLGVFAFGDLDVSGVYQASGVNRVSRVHGSFIHSSTPFLFTPGDSLIR